MDKKVFRISVPVVAQRLGEYIKTHPYGYSDAGATSALEMIYAMYADTRGKDPEAISAGFEALERYMAGISLEHNNNIFSLVCNICNLYEERAFKDGLQLGAYLILELQG